MTREKPSSRVQPFFAMLTLTGTLSVIILCTSEMIRSSGLSERILLMAGIPVLVLLAVGTLVFFAGKRDLSSLLFLLYCTTTAVNNVCQFPRLGGTTLSQNILNTAFTLFSLQSPALGLHLFTRFPARGALQIRLSRWLPFAYAIQTVFGLSFLLPIYSPFIRQVLSSGILRQTLLELFNGNVVVCSALSAISLASMALGPFEERVQRQARLLLVAFILLTLLQLGLYALPVLLTGKMAVSAEAYALIDLIVPLFVALAILFHRLFGIDVLVRQGFIYALSSSIVGGTFLLLMFALGSFAGRIWENPNTVVVALAAALAALLFQPVQARSRRWVDRVLYRQRYSYHRLLTEISRQLNAILDLPSLVLLLQTRIGEALQPELLEIAVFHPERELFEKIDPEGRRRLLAEGEEAARLRERMLRQGAPFTASLLPLSGIELLVPLIHGGKLQGAILLGPRSKDLPYRPVDHEFLATVAGMASTVMENAMLLEERRKHERLAMVGSATSAIAHELKNPLSAIKTSAAILRRRLGDDERGRELTRVVEEEVDRLQASVLQVLGFVRSPDGDRVPIDIGELLEQLLAVVKADFETCSVQVRLDIDCPPVPVHGDPERLRMAVLNLLINSKEALGRGGNILIRVRPWQREETSGVEITVGDDGPGFRMEDLHRVFEPFYSGKRLGTGLGLANVERTVVEHGGEVFAANGEMGGALVTIRLPAADQGDLT